MKKNILLVIASILVVSCQSAYHHTMEHEIGSPVSESEMEKLLDEKTEIKVEMINAANWEVDLNGLLDLSHPKAKAAKIENKKYPVHVYTYLVKHPKFGNFLIDSGLSNELKTNPEKLGLGFLIRKVMNLDALKIVKTTSEIKSELNGKINGVFFTHLHIDHIMGVPDLDKETPLYIGKTESSHKYFMNLFTYNATDAFFEGKNPLIELPTDKYKIIDFFGDKTLFVLSVPGHTSGSLAFIIKTNEGPVLIAGDTSHTKWGWENDVPPGKFTRDDEGNLKSLLWLKSLYKKHPSMKVYLGHEN